MGMSRSTYYFEINKIDIVEKRNESLLAEIIDIFDYHKHRYGVRRVHQELLKRGLEVNHKRVQRLMHCAGLFGNRPKEKYHSFKGEVSKIADNIISRNFTATRPLEKWTTDVSQFNFSWGKCYLSPILDMCTNEIVSYDLVPIWVKLNVCWIRLLQNFLQYQALLRILTKVGNTNICIIGTH